MRISNILLLIGIVSLLLGFGWLFACGDDDDDSSDDDDDNTGAYTCEDFCAKVEECGGLECVTGECADWCTANATAAILDCISLSTCANFENCVCQGDDDDTGDDDTGDDDTGDDDTGDDDTGDDDTVDDDTGDDDTVNESYIYDDGTAENAVIGVNHIFAIAMKPSGYPAYLTEASFYAMIYPGAQDYQVLIYKDTDEDGPDAGELAFTSDTETAPEGEDVWVDFNLAAAGFTEALNAGRWLVGIKVFSIGGPEVFTDNSTTTPACYRFDGSSWSVYDEDSIFIIRGEGYYHTR